METYICSWVVQIYKRTPFLFFLNQHQKIVYLYQLSLDSEIQHFWDLENNMMQDIHNFENKVWINSI